MVFDQDYQWEDWLPQGGGDQTQDAPPAGPVEGNPDGTTPSPGSSPFHPPALPAPAPNGGNPGGSFVEPPPDFPNEGGGDDGGDPGDFVPPPVEVPMPPTPAGVFVSPSNPGTLAPFRSSEFATNRFVGGPGGSGDITGGAAARGGEAGPTEEMIRRAIMAALSKMSGGRAR